MEIVLGADHGGVDLKEWVKEKLTLENYTLLDVGIEPGQEADCPIIAQQAAKLVLEKPDRVGLLFCGTGIGISIAANKVSGIRAALCTDCYSARMAKEHNNANVLTFGGRTEGREPVWMMIQTFLHTKFQAGVHSRRLAQLES